MPDSIALRDQIPEVGASREKLEEASRSGPVLLVFLRHFGCTFCREALADLSRARRSLEQNGVRLAVVHMSTREKGREYRKKYRLDDAVFISDPGKTLYREFGLKRGKAGQLFGPKVWMRGLKAGVLEGHGIGWLEGDGLQMPGTFVLKDGAVIYAQRAETAADRPSYVSCVSTACQIEEPAET